MIEQIDITTQNIQKRNKSSAIVVFASERKFDYSFWESVADSGVDVFIFDNEEEIEQLLKSQTVKALYIRSDNRFQFQSFTNRIKKLYNGISIIFYTDVNELLLQNNSDENQTQIIKDNFKLLNSFLIKSNQVEQQHINDVVKYVELMCDRLDISGDQKLNLISASYIHSISEFLKDDNSPNNNEKEVIKFTSQNLKTKDYNSNICKILDLTYIDISMKPAQTDNVILANILTVVDFYCHSKFNKPSLTPEQFRELDKNIQFRIGSLFIPEIGKELFRILYENIEISQSTPDDCNVIIYNEMIDDKLMLQSCLNNLGFHVRLVSSLDELRASYDNSKADILVVDATGTALQISDLISQIEERNIDFDSITTYILTNKESIAELTGLLQKGIEDIFNCDTDIDPFLVKLIRHRKRLIELTKKQTEIFENMGTFGSLSDMNLIDLLQTMNGSGKTCLINISAEQSQLTIHISNGNIISAEVNDVKGEQAIFIGLAWNKGVWSVDPLDANCLPTPNIDKSINCILLAGCQYMDESQKIVTTTEQEINFDFDENLD